MTKDGRRDYGTVTPRILAGLSRGQSTREIADAVNSDTATVRTIAYRNGWQFDANNDGWFHP